MTLSVDQDVRKAGTIWARNLDGTVPFIRPRCEAAFGRIGPEAAEALAAALGPGSLPEILRRFEAGRQCYAAWIGHKLATYGWVSFNEEIVGELNLHLQLVLGEAYIWDCATLPAFRNQHLYSALLSHILLDLYAQPVCRVWIGANLDNLASQRGIARVGFHHVAELLVVRVLARSVVWAQGAPDVPDSWVAEARRVYLGSREKVWLEAMPAARPS